MANYIATAYYTDKILFCSKKYTTNIIIYKTQKKETNRSSSS